MKHSMYRVDVSECIESHQVGTRQICIFAICALVAMADGFDAQAIGYVAPSIIHAWGISRAALAPVFAAGLAGMAFGGMLCGPLADRFGRRPVLLASILLFSVVTLLITLSETTTSLLILRFIAGVGLGGAMPNAIALTAEYCPSKIRATVMMLMYSGFSVGAAAGGFLSSALITSFGWHSVFLVGGMFPACVGLVVLLWLPESIAFMATKGGRDIRIAGMLNRFRWPTEFTAEMTFTVPERPAERSPLRSLFTPEHVYPTCLLWIVYFLCFLVLYLLSNWLPIMINDAGASIDSAVRISVLYQIGGILGPVALGRIMDRTRPAAVLTIVLFCGGFCVFLFGVSNVASLTLLAVLVAAAGVCVIGSATISHLVAAEAYPVSLRATGLGWSFAMGRIGGITGSLYGGLLFSLQLNIHEMLIAGAVPLFFAGVAAFLFARNKQRGSSFFVTTKYPA